MNKQELLRDNDALQTENSLLRECVHSKETIIRCKDDEIKSLKSRIRTFESAKPMNVVRACCGLDGVKNSCVAVHTESFKKASTNPSLRTCVVEEKECGKPFRKVFCAFHRWVDKEEIVISFRENANWSVVDYVRTKANEGVILNPDNCVSKTCKISATFGLVEYPDGHMVYVKPENITFKEEEDL